MSNAAEISRQLQCLECLKDLTGDVQGRAGVPFCSRCNSATYCSQSCQRAHWNSTHYLECRHFPTKNNPNPEIIVVFDLDHTLLQASESPTDKEREEENVKYIGLKPLSKNGNGLHIALRRKVKKLFTFLHSQENLVLMVYTSGVTEYAYKAVEEIEKEVGMSIFHNRIIARRKTDNPNAKKSLRAVQECLAQNDVKFASPADVISRLLIVDDRIDAWEDMLQPAVIRVKPFEFFQVGPLSFPAFLGLQRNYEVEIGTSDKRDTQLAALKRLFRKVMSNFHKASVAVPGTTVTEVLQEMRKIVLHGKVLVLCDILNSPLIQEIPIVQELERFGAQVVSETDKSVTHIVALNEQSESVTQARKIAPHAHVVHINWILDSTAYFVPSSEALYELVAPLSEQHATNNDDELSTNKVKTNTNSKRSTGNEGATHEDSSKPVPKALSMLSSKLQFPKSPARPLFVGKAADSAAVSRMLSTKRKGPVVSHKEANKKPVTSSNPELKKRKVSSSVPITEEVVSNTDSQAAKKLLLSMELKEKQLAEASRKLRLQNAKEKVLNQAKKLREIAKSRVELENAAVRKLLAKEKAEKVARIEAQSRKHGSYTAKKTHPDQFAQKPASKLRENVVNYSTKQTTETAASAQQQTATITSQHSASNVPNFVPRNPGLPNLALMSTNSRDGGLSHLTPLQRLRAARASRQAPATGNWAAPLAPQVPMSQNRVVAGQGSALRRKVVASKAGNPTMQSNPMLPPDNIRSSSASGISEDTKLSALLPRNGTNSAYIRPSNQIDRSSSTMSNSDNVPSSGTSIYLNPALLSNAQRHALENNADARLSWEQQLERKALENASKRAVSPNRSASPTPKRQVVIDLDSDSDGDTLLSTLTNKQSPRTQKRRVSSSPKAKSQQSTTLDSMWQPKQVSGSDNKEKGKATSSPLSALPQSSESKSQSWKTIARNLSSSSIQTIPEYTSSSLNPVGTSSQELSGFGHDRASDVIVVSPSIRGSSLPKKVTAAVKRSSVPKKVATTKLSSVPKKVSAAKSSPSPKKVAATKRSSVPKKVSATKNSPSPKRVSAAKSSPLPKRGSAPRSASSPQTSAVRNSSTPQVSAIRKAIAKVINGEGDDETESESEDVFWRSKK